MSFAHSSAVPGRLADKELFLLGRGTLPIVPFLSPIIDVTDKDAWLGELPVSSWQPPKPPGS